MFEASHTTARASPTIPKQTHTGRKVTMSGMKLRIWGAIAVALVVAVARVLRVVIVLAYITVPIYD